MFINRMCATMTAHIYARHSTRTQKAIGEGILIAGTSRADRKVWGLASNLWKRMVALGAIASPGGGKQQQKPDSAVCEIFQKAVARRRSQCTKKRKKQVAERSTAIIMPLFAVRFL
ncbi:unnamed protein product [Gongylonema pulchrum]|uniref:Uncharacterized protein n=1 Tax=Gongylonema pulchrum TaxID=637853 RepID=A0A3P6QNX5_9BILA|nr:unnamed protein product [Gongylonema pulchrum]